MIEGLGWVGGGRAEFLDQTGSIVPWADLLALAGPLRPTAGRRSRQFWPAETLPGMRLARCWPGLSDEDACHDSLSVRDFVCVLSSCFE